jgi:EmrB/QacA subfamily drug resistance transporter
VLIAVGAGTFMSALDISVVNTVLPVVTRTFNTEVATVEWVVIVYLLLVSGMLPSFGRLGDLRGHKSVYIAGFFLFILSSVLCGLAPSVLALIGARCLQALGAAMLSANSPAILTKSFPDAQRGQALGMQATMTYLGLTVGPSLGGWLTDQFSWRAVFLINVPVGLTALLLSMRFIQHDRPGIVRERFDWIGALLFMTGLVTLLLGLNQGHNWGWTSPAILGLLGGSLFLLGLFVWYEGRVQSPMLDLSLFKSRLFSASISAAVLNYICVYSILFLMPFYLIQARQFSPSYAGLLLSVQPLIMAIVAPISGTLSDRIGVRLPSTLGMGILAMGLFLLSRLGPVSSPGAIAAAMLISGLGIGIFISPNNSALLGSAPRNRQGIAAGLLATARNVGMVLGVGLAGAIFTTIMAQVITPIAAEYQAISPSLMVAASVALLGMMISAMRGETYTNHSIA